ncbi:MAG: 16S rRNA (cytosine(967)-C(5))-methyltransferase RsmB [Formosimonas sp.]
MNKRPAKPKKPAVERVDLATVKVYNLPATSLGYQISMAAHVVAAVRQGYSMQHALSAIEMDDAARANVQRLSFDTMRHWGCTHVWLTHFIANAPTVWVQSLLSVALTQLRQNSVSEFVLVDQTVAAAENFKPHAKGLVNAILRKFLREREAWEALVAGDLEATYNYPQWWIEAVQAAHPEQWADILAVGNSHPPMTLRVNARHATAQQYVAQLQNAGLSGRAMPAMSAQAIVLDAPCHVNALPDFATGAVSVQDAGAQCAPDFLDLRDGLRVLDACAAPGGKTGHILERYDVELTALEKDPLRAQRIDENLARLKLSANVVVCDANNVHQWWDGVPFDRILLDAPCSASGIVRRHPDIRWLRARDDLAGLARQQAQLLRTMWKVLAVGGRLVYCTCSIFPAEGEEVIQAFLAHTPNAKRVPLPVAQLLPHADEHLNHDGFFYAALLKTA